MTLLSPPTPLRYGLTVLLVLLVFLCFGDLDPVRAQGDQAGVDRNPDQPGTTEGASPPPLVKAGDILLEDVVVVAPKAKKKKRVVQRKPAPTGQPEPLPTRDESPDSRARVSDDFFDLPTVPMDRTAAGDGSAASGAAASGAGPDGAAATGAGGAGEMQPGQAVADVRAVDQKLIPASVTVIEREAFEGQVEDLAEVIEKEAGVQVRQSGGLGSFSTVSLRGSTSDQVMIFMDGILLNDASGGGVNLSNISLADVESIEIYRGVSPINFGKASIGGAINIRTLQTRKGLKASVGAGYGSFNTQKYFGYVNHKPGDWDYLVSADYLGSDNNFEFLNDIGTDWNTSDDRWEERQNAQFHQYNALAKFGYDFSPNLRWDVMGQYFSKDQGLPNWINAKDAKTSLDTRREIAAMRFTRRKFTTLNLDTELRFDYSHKEEEYDDREGDVGLGYQHNRYTTTRFGVSLFSKWDTDFQTISFLAEASQEEYEPEDLLKGDDPKGSSRELLNVGLQDSLKFFDRKLIVTPAVRYTWLKDVLESGTDVWGYTDGEGKREEDYLGPQIGFKFSPLGWLTLKGNLAGYVREPSFFELFGDRGFFVGNEELKAEKGVNSDIGFGVNWFPDGKLISRITFNAAYFNSDVEDLITRVYDSRGVGRSVNISDSNIHGLETDVKIDIFKYLSLVGKYTWQDSENKSQLKSFAGKQLPGRFRDSWLGRIEARYAGIKMFGEYVYEKGLYYDTANLVEAETKKEINAGISYLYKSYLFSLEGKNLGDEQYEDFNGYPLPGRAFNFTVKYDF